MDPTYIASNPTLNQDANQYTALTGQIPGSSGQQPPDGTDSAIQQRFQSDITKGSFKPDKINAALSMAPNNAQSFNNRTQQQQG